MASGNYNFSVYQGVPFDLSVTLQDDNGSYINLSGYTISGYVKNQYTDTVVLYNINPTIDTSYVSGLININIPGSGTASLPVLQGVYDMYIYDSGGSATQILAGDFLVNPSSTTATPPFSIPIGVIPTGNTYSNGVAGLADQVYEELGEPAGYSVPVIAYWFRANIGKLNNALNTSFYINSTTLEIERVDPSDSATILKISDDEKSIFKMMYTLHYYDGQIRQNMLNYASKPVTEIATDGHSIRLASQTEIGKNLSKFRNDLALELREYLHYYRIARAVPRAVHGDDNVDGSTNYNPPVYRTNFDIYNRN